MKLPSGDLPILFGRLAIPARTQVRTGYLARPDLKGVYPAVVVVPSARGLSSSVRALCRSLARYGLAMLAVDPYRGDGPGPEASDAEVAAARSELSDRRMTADVLAAVRFIGAPQTTWSASDRIGVLGIGVGGRSAALAARSRSEVAALALCYAPLTDEGPGGEPSVLEVLGASRIALLGLHGRVDEVVPPEQVEQARRAVPAARWVVYQDAGHDFLDESRDAYDPAAAADAAERLAGFFLTELSAGLAETG